MAVRLYDEALFEKIQRWVKDPKMRILKPSEVTRMIQTRADLGNDAPLTLPIIALSRDTEIEILSVNKKPTSFDGMMLESSAEEKKTLQLNMIPIRITYQLDIYTRFFEEGDEYLRNFIFNMINYPGFKVVVPYNDVKKEYSANITLISTVEDNSDIAQRLFTDQFTRWTIRFTIEDAHLFSAPYVTNVTMDKEIQIEIQEK